ncbi:hypothetical protein J6590_026965 [Homalodisca vitripennis]|nr:hypothetical protein J6590_026965 [Homalodisca vitripennis]
MLTLDGYEVNISELGYLSSDRHSPLLLSTRCLIGCGTRGITYQHWLTLTPVGLIAGPVVPATVQARMSFLILLFLRLHNLPFYYSSSGNNIRLENSRVVVECVQPAL